MRTRALFIRIVKQFLRDRRTLALLILAPLLVLSLMYLVFNGDTYRPKLGTVQIPSGLQQQLERKDAELHVYGSSQEAEQALLARHIDAYLALRDGVPIIRLEGSNPSHNQAIMMILSEAAGQGGAWSNTTASADSGTRDADAANAAAPVTEYLHGGADMTTFDSLGPVLIGVFAFFFVFLIAGVSFLKERTSGTLERLLATPLRRWEVVVGYILGFGLFTGIQTILIAEYSIQVLGLMMTGSIWYVLLITLLLSLTALSFGTLMSTFANSEFQMIQFIPLVIVPQVFFSGLFDLETMSSWLRWLAHLMPIKYGADALRSVMIRGEGWHAIQGDIYILIGLSLLFMSANVLALRKHRKI
ncbi:ABC transporter permease [Paenibacillus sp. 598K]|uniref:ABC transporter permease n=1 Tax=Paenibacillus sp. 598K TaxID=1117987 RepID=UPI000FF91029|nr:ABC transporter permease [Paenibacillus sp. 598K]GBF71849.1 ABC transporter permease [Paenibacillus sp. 598K]